MNWRIEARADGLSKADVDVAHAEGEDDDARPDSAIVTKARRAAAALAAELGGDVLVTVEGHETLKGRGFRPAHVTLTTSRVAPGG